MRYLQTQNVLQDHNSNNLNVFYASLFHIITTSASGQRTASEQSANSLTHHLTGSARVETVL